MHHIIKLDLVSWFCISMYHGNYPRVNHIYHNLLCISYWFDIMESTTMHHNILYIRYSRVYRIIANICVPPTDITNFLMRWTWQTRLYWNVTTLISIIIIRNGQQLMGGNGWGYSTSCQFFNLLAWYILLVGLIVRRLPSIISFDWIYRLLLYDSCCTFIDTLLSH
jgi:hypothetical protein